MSKYLSRHMIIMCVLAYMVNIANIIHRPWVQGLRLCRKESKRKSGVSLSTCPPDVEIWSRFRNFVFENLLTFINVQNISHRHLGVSKEHNTFVVIVSKALIEHLLDVPLRSICGESPARYYPTFMDHPQASHM
jgi:hypothetical protein